MVQQYAASSPQGIAVSAREEFLIHLDPSLMAEFYFPAMLPSNRSRLNPAHPTAAQHDIAVLELKMAEQVKHIKPTIETEIRLADAYEARLMEMGFLRDMPQIRTAAARGLAVSFREIADTRARQFCTPEMREQIINARLDALAPLDIVPTGRGRR